MPATCRGPSLPPPTEQPIPPGFDGFDSGYLRGDAEGAALLGDARAAGAPPAAAALAEEAGAADASAAEQQRKSEEAALRAANALIEEGNPLTPSTAAMGAEPTPPLKWVDTPLGTGVGGEPGAEQFCAKEQQEPLSSSSGAPSRAATPDADTEKPKCDWPPFAALGRAAAAFADVRRCAEERTKGMRSWREFADQTKFSTPSQIEALSRARVNLIYFRVNYLFLAAALTLWTVATHLIFSACLLGCMGAWRYYHWATADGQPFQLFGRSVTAAQAYASLLAGTVLVFWLGGGSSTVFWLVASLLGVVLGHASLREGAATPESLALETLQSLDGQQWV